MRDDRLRLADILDAIGQINRYAAAGRAEFDENELVRVWILHHLQVIGGMPRAIRATHPDEISSEAKAGRYSVCARTI